MPNQNSSDWLDKTGFGVVGKFTLDDGEEVTAEIIDYNDDTGELTVAPLILGSPQLDGERATRAIEVGRVRSFVPEAPSARPWPHSDPCRTGGSSLLRLTVLASLFLASTLGSLLLFIICMSNEPYRLQEISALSYTLAVVWLTFAAHRDAPRFRLSCPAVKSQLPALLWRHISFLLALLVLQTGALSIRPKRHAWWSLQDSKGGTPFELFLLFLCMGLGLAEVYMNRSNLTRAHADLRFTKLLGGPNPPAV